MHLISQTEQNGGYWLITLQLDSNTLLPFGYQLHLDNRQPLALFQQKEYEAQFLSLAPLDNAAESLIATSPPGNQNTPAWQILSKQVADASQTENPILLLAKNENIANLLHFAQMNAQQHDLIAILEATDAFPFIVKPAKFLFEGLPPEAIGACPLLEDWKVPNRLCALNGLMGCYDGSIEDILQNWKPDASWATIDFRSLNKPLTNS
ncbi:hypothetical protein [Hydrogenovibrio kuenenii]|uniref:hypothetical protein n=1 Tax=Hydrogenovibrio kuenenii TaxID=63658 RepID=UPI000465261D|nr:hypothetical protein [Hydrogenovibrio kuenenii]